MDILEQAQNIQWKEAGEQIMEKAQQMGIAAIDLRFVDVLRYFDVTTSELMADKSRMKKIQTIYEFFKESEDVMADLRKMCSNLGNPVGLEEKLNAIYAHVYSLKIEEKFAEKDEKSSEALELFAQKAHDMLLMKKEEETKTRAEQRKQQEAKKQERSDKIKEVAQKTRNEKQVKKVIDMMEKTRPPAPPKPPKVEI